MGCSSSSGANAKQPSAGKKAGCIGMVNWTYFGDGAGRADPIHQMFEYHGQPNTKNSIMQADWPKHKMTPVSGEFNSLPVFNFEQNGKKI